MLINWIHILQGHFTAIGQPYNGPVKQAYQVYLINMGKCIIQKPICIHQITTIAE